MSQHHQRSMSLRSSTSSVSTTSSGRTSASLDTFSQSSSANHVAFTPRSREALNRLGLQPSELFVKPVAAFEAELRISQPNSMNIPESAQRKFAHYEQKRVAAVLAARNERNRIIDELSVQQQQQSAANDDSGYGYGHDSYGSPGGHNRSLSLSTRTSPSPTRPRTAAPLSAAQSARARSAHLVDLEHARLAKQQERHMKKLSTILTHEIRKQQTHERFQAHIEQQRLREEQDRAYRARAIKEREEREKRQQDEKRQREAQAALDRQQYAKEQFEENVRRIEAQKIEQEQKRREARERQIAADERHREHQQHIAAIKAQQLQQIQDKEYEIRMKEQARQEALENQRAFHAAEMEAAARRTRERIEIAQARDRQLTEQKRAAYEARAAWADDKRVEFEEQREQAKIEARRRMMEKDAHIKNAKLTAEQILEQKRLRVQHKAEALARRRAEEAGIREEIEQQKREYEDERDARRRTIRQQQIDRLNERLANVMAKREYIEQRNQRAALQRQASQEERKLRTQLQMDDRREQVQRNQRRKEHERTLMLQRIEDDQRRVAAIQEEVKSVAEERRRLREASDQQQKTILKNFERLKNDPTRLAQLTAAANDPHHMTTLTYGLLQHDMAISNGTPYNGNGSDASSSSMSYSSSGARVGAAGYSSSR